jgi:hypothetical protein
MVALPLPSSAVLCSRVVGSLRGAWACQRGAASVTAHRACDYFAQFAEPQYRTCDRRAEKPIAGVEAASRERFLQEGYVE